MHSCNKIRKETSPPSGLKHRNTYGLPATETNEKKKKRGEGGTDLGRADEVVQIRDLQHPTEMTRHHALQ